MFGVCVALIVSRGGAMIGTTSCQGDTFVARLGFGVNWQAFGVPVNASTSGR